MIIKNISTTSTIALFLIISVTGILLLLHMGGGSIKVVHEWLGVAFVIFGLLHVTANWRLMKGYLGGWKVAAIGGILISTVAFTMVPQAESKGSPVRAMFRQAINSPISTLALFYGVESDEVVERLQQEGLTVSSSEKTPFELSQQFHVAPEKILAVISQTSEK